MIAQSDAASSPIPSRLAALRTKMRRASLAAYIIPSTDPHQSEYTPAYWQRRQWLSGFTGSVGDLVVTLDQACLWTDSRYFLQAEEQLLGTTIELQRMGQAGVPTLKAWLAENLERGQLVGVDPRLISLDGRGELERALEPAGVELALVENNLVDELWDDDRPAPPDAPLRLHPRRYAGASTAEKLSELREKMEEAGASALLIPRLDAAAWLFNIRGGDVDFTPVAVAYGLVTADRAMLFVDEHKVDGKVDRALSPEVQVRPYEAVAEELGKLGRAGVTVWVDPAATTAWAARALEGAELLRRPDPITATKARKCSTEIRGARAAHLRDGLALVRFLRWLQDSVGHQKVTELSAAAKLEALRAELELFQGLSFRTISAVGAHGAIVHYGATTESDRPLRPRGLYLVDSGGQYLDGTTDVTRTVLLGDEASEEHRDRFTRVLKGHIAIASTRFPAGVSGQRLDALARRALWAAGLDYGHGTGHGVGSFLGVHESPPGIAPARLLTVPLEEGHILSNEPGYYRTGRYGIRIENLLLVTRDPELSKPRAPFLRFETLTLCPIDRRLIERELLDRDEHRWLDDYHRRVRDALSPLLDQDDARWLAEATAPI